MDLNFIQLEMVSGHRHPDSADALVMFFDNLVFCRFPFCLKISPLLPLIPFSEPVFDEIFIHGLGQLYKNDLSSDVAGRSVTCGLDIGFFQD
jgi:hypothetical protein